LKRILIFCDIVFLLISICFMIYTSFIPFFNHNNIFIFVIIPIYEIINTLKIIIIFIFHTREKIKKSKLAKIWLIISFISLTISVLFIFIVLWTYSHGA
jgi:hypothetical protein